MSSDKFEKQVQQVARKNGEKAVLAAVNKLPAGLKGIGRRVLGRKPTGKGEELPWRTQESEGRAAVRDIDGLPAAKRRKLFDAMFPLLGAQVEAAWHALKAQPYQERYSVQGFRAPSHPELTAEKRREWLSNLVSTVADYPCDIVWFATWAAHLDEYWVDETLGVLFAATIDAGGKTGDAVFELMCAALKGEHEIAQMGRHVLSALLTASRPEGWELVEKTLLAAQRQEGLRQAILESIDTAHPEAFRRMLGVIREHDLGRFSAVVRAMDTWFSFLYAAGNVKKSHEICEKVERFLGDPKAQQAGIADDDAETRHLALWTLAYQDAVAALPVIAKVLEDERLPHRLVAASLLADLDYADPWLALLPLLEDESLWLATYGLGAARRLAESGHAPKGLFQRVEQIVDRFPAKPQKCEPLVWPWSDETASRKEAVEILAAIGSDLDPMLLVPYFKDLDTFERRAIVEKLGRKKKQTADTRAVLLGGVGDASAEVREAAVAAMQRLTIKPDEAPGLEALLHRSASDLRRGVLNLLAGQKDAAALASGERLCASGKAKHREAGLELYRILMEAGRAADTCRERILDYAAGRKKLTANERVHVEAAENAGKPKVTLDDCLGLLEGHTRTPPATPKPRKAKLLTPAAAALLQSLDKLVHAHRKEVVEVHGYDDEVTQAPLGSLEWGFRLPDWNKPVEGQLHRWPLREVWQAWWNDRPKSQRDADGLELLRASAVLRILDDIEYDDDASQVRKQLFGAAKPPKVKYDELCDDILIWLLRLEPPAAMADWVTDVLESLYAALPEKELAKAEDPKNYRLSTWRESGHAEAWLNVVQWTLRCFGDLWIGKHHARLYALLRWRDEPGTAVPRERPESDILVAARVAGAATDGDLLDELLGPRDVGSSWYGHNFDFLRAQSRQKPTDEQKAVPSLRGLVNRCRERVLEVEWTRGDQPSVCSAAAKCLRYTGGAGVLVNALTALGKEPFLRGWSSDNLSRKTVFSSIVRGTRPGKGDTAASLKKLLKQAAIPEQRIVETAMFAPQWAAHIETALGWTGLEDAIWWFHAHTKDDAWSVDGEVQEIWKAQVNERTPLESADLMDGAVDVAWFQRARATLGAKRWAQVDAAAKYASSSGGHKRAQLFSQALTGATTAPALTKLITGKRQQESVRALGLIPLPKAKRKAKAEVLSRYEVFQEFTRSSRKFGSQRQESEKRAVRIGMDNLARTAGYADPVRLQWAMEAEAIADLAKGPVTVTVDGCTVSLAIDDTGGPDFRVRRGEKTLKSVPAKLRKNPKIAELRARSTELKRQRSRIRASLEQAMVRGDLFTGAEFKELCGHAILKPMLERLVIAGGGGLGYPIKGGIALEAFDGTVFPVGASEEVRLAHASDLLKSRKWSKWQRDCFARERVQPFKQVFRELYVPTKAEKATKHHSARYAGQQVQPRQALALLGKRGWVNHPEEGVRKVFHDAKLAAWLTFEESFYTPADIEGLTLDTVAFSERGKWKRLPLTKVPPRLFSEVMRDLDLVVSVAHAGGVDPEASASTVEMRAALLQETCKLLGLKNVTVQDHHALITGSLAEYSLHLGSAVVHKLGGTQIAIVAVHGQHRGRLFLPFADDDPRTAEVISKTLLLARDGEIKDPSILEQIRRR